MNRPFRAILILVTLMIIGVAMIPLLNVQYMPSLQQAEISIRYSWPGASAKVMESQVTSKIEGAIAPISAISSLNSTTYKESGEIWVAFKKGVNLDAARFELSSKIRSIYPFLPPGVTYPEISSGVRGDSPTPILSYTISANMSTWDIQRYAQTKIVDKLAAVEGVENVDVNGATPWQWEVLFDAQKCANLRISSTDINQAFRLNSAVEPLGICNTTPNGDPISVNLECETNSPENWETIEIKNVDGHIIMLGDIATVNLAEQPARSYRRLNGLNNINMVIFAAPDVNTLTVAADVKQTLKDLDVPPDFSITLADDSTDYIKKELDKIYSRTGLSILILLLFVYLTSRNLRYLLLIMATLTANILIAFIFYNILGIQIHLYSLAGITVSLGMIIDTSIIMIDHYSRFGNRKVFLAIMAALLTTIGALSIVYFLPDEQRANLVDFAVVIIINLTVSLFISMLFIPALVDRFPVRFKSKRYKTKGKRWIVRFTHLYGRFISFSRRYKWAYIVIALLAFGVPVQMLPEKIGQPKQGVPLHDSVFSFWQSTYNKTIGSSFYQQTLKTYVEPILGGSLRLFAKDIFSSYQATTPERTKLYINASLPEGCTIEQLNDVVKEMENYLSQFSEIDLFRTSIMSYRRGEIVVTFHKQAERAGFAFRLKDLVTSKAISLGGADWSVFGVGQGFNNSLSSGWKSNAIILQGYNYDILYAIGQELCDTLLRNQRVSAPVIAGNRWETQPRSEYFMNFDFEKFALYKVSPVDYFSSLKTRLYSSVVGQYYNSVEQQDIVLKSTMGESFDVWHLENDQISLGDGKNVKLSQFGTIKKVTSGNNIYKTDQQYTLTVAFDFIGSTELASRYEKRQIERLKETLPVGYSISEQSWGWWGRDNSLPYALLGLVAVIIFFICAVLFESIRQPLVIISMIPISFIGVFMTFYLFKLPFDQGGFASFVLLCGIVVNAGIYLVNEYNIMLRTGQKSGLTRYLKSYNRKIIPITLTIISTVLGLLPFVVISREPFWFSFAAGAMGGMIFSLLAIIIFLPIFLPLKR